VAKVRNIFYARLSRNHVYGCSAESDMTKESGTHARQTSVSFSFARASPSAIDSVTVPFDVLLTYCHMQQNLNYWTWKTGGSLVAAI